MTLANATLGTDPVVWQILKRRAGINPVFRVANLWIIRPTTRITLILSHGALLQLGVLRNGEPVFLVWPVSHYNIGRTPDKQYRPKNHPFRARLSRLTERDRRNPASRHLSRTCSLLVVRAAWSVFWFDLKEDATG